jgi:hypothetical protein
VLRACVAGLVAAATIGFVVLAAPVGGTAAAGARTTASGASGASGGSVLAFEDPGQPDPTASTAEPPPPTEPATEPPSPGGRTPSDPGPQPTEPAPGPPSAAPGPTEGQPTTNPEPSRTAGPQEPAPSSAPPSGQPGPSVPGKGKIGVWVTTGDVRLDSAYWSTGASVKELKVTVWNTGTLAEKVQLRYTLPAGLSDAGTQGCVGDGGNNHRCGAWTAPAGARWTTRVKVRVAADAWRLMPLSGSVKVLAAAPSEPSLGAVQDNEGFAVLFPPDPHVAGLAVEAGEVRFASSDAPAQLQVRLRNTGNAVAKGSVDVLLPTGVTVDEAGKPATCVTDPAKTHCELGSIAAGRTGRLDLRIKAPLTIQRLAPLSGAVIATLTRRGKVQTVRMSFKITALAASSTPAPATPLATGSQGTLGAFAPAAGEPNGMSGLQKTALALVVVSILLVVLALALATTSLRRRMEDDQPAAPPDRALPAD